MLTNGGGRKGGIGVTRKNLAEGRMWLVVIGAHDISFLGTTPLTDTKERTLCQILVVISFSKNTGLEMAKS